MSINPTNSTIEVLQTYHQTTMKIALFFLLATLAVSSAWFLPNREIKRMLRFFPTLNEIFGDHPEYHERRDSAEIYRPTLKSSKGRNVHYAHSYGECDHPEHHYATSRHPETEETFYEQKPAYKEKMSLKNKKKEMIVDESESHEFGKLPKINLKKDYITGVLVAIPKVKNDEQEEQKAKGFFESLLLKGDDSERSQERSDVTAEDVIKSYIY